MTNPQTLTIRGHTERSYTSVTLAAGLTEGSPTGGAITEGSEGSKTHRTAKDKGSASKNTSTALAIPKKAQQSSEKYWVSERSHGGFARTFSFPTSVDQDHVQASLKNGVLSVVVPKPRKPEGRKITIS